MKKRMRLGELHEGRDGAASRVKSKRNGAEEVTTCIHSITSATSDTVATGISRNGRYCMARIIAQG